MPISDALHELRIKAVLRLSLTAYRIQRWASEEHKRLIALRSADTKLSLTIGPKRGFFEYD